VASLSPFSLYIHIPFCIRKCPYCDFATEASKKIPEDIYLRAIISELSYYINQIDWFDRSITTIFFGGGTPSLLSSQGIETVLQSISNLCKLSSDIEITLEANPETVDKTKAQDWKSVGINRVSLGVQSFSERHLNQLGRHHSPKQSKFAIECLIESNITNVSLDLIYGLPSQTDNELMTDLNTARSLCITHLSAYSLTIEHGTPLASHVLNKTVIPLDDDIVGEHFDLISTILSTPPWYRYEVSNFATPNYESRHNRAYWDGKDYLGIGAGAHSYVRGFPSKRWANVRLWEPYVQRVSNNLSPVAWKETLSFEREIEEFLLLRLRLTDGASHSDFKSQFNFDVEHYFPEVLDELKQNNLITDDGQRFATTSKGMRLLDSVIEKFVAEFKANE